MQHNTNVLTIDCKNVKCYLIKTNKGFLMFDASWPDKYKEWKDSVRNLGIKIEEITTFIVSHFHIDHAGLAGTLCNNGKEFIVFESQLDQIEVMEDLIERKNYPYYKIDRSLINYKKISESREWLQSLEVEGEIIQTVGHGEEGIALILDTGEALIGDVPVIREYDEKVQNDWKRLDQLGARYIYPAHAEYFEK